MPDQHTCVIGRSPAVIFKSLRDIPPLNRRSQFWPKENKSLRRKPLLYMAKFHTGVYVLQGYLRDLLTIHELLNICGSAITGFSSKFWFSTIWTIFCFDRCDGEDSDLQRGWHLWTACIAIIKLFSCYSLPWKLRCLSVSLLKSPNCNSWEDALLPITVSEAGAVT